MPIAPPKTTIPTYKSILFVYGNGKINTKEIKQQEKYWIKTKNLFKGTDFTVNYYNIQSNKIKIFNNSSITYYELINHKYIYIIGINKYGKISLVHEVNLVLPKDAPPY